MASASGLLSEELLRCVVCLDVFTDPISTPCGHTFCRSCITHYWDTSYVCQCPLCKRIFNTRPEVSVNTCISEMVHQFRRLKWKVEFEAKTKDEIQQMIQERQLKMQDVKHSVELSRKDADTVIADSVQVFTALTSSFAILSLLSCIERSQAELIAVIEEKQETTEKQAEGFIKDLEKEITQLEKRISELKQLSHTEDHLHLLQNFTITSINTPPPLKDWTKVNVHQFSYVGTVRTAVAQLEKTLEKTLSQEMEKKLCDVELRRFQQYEVDVTLDTDTANSYLILSEAGKQVSHGDITKNLPDNTKRFSPCPCVLGKQSFSSGRFYYEVQVKGKTDWYLGVARGSINRKEDVYLMMSPDDGCWTIGLEYGNEYKAYTDPDDDGGCDVLLPVREELQKVGVFVGYEEGLVSFYDVEAKVHLYSFTGCSFTEKLYPLFSPDVNDGGRNSAPLIISPVNMNAGLGGDGGNMSPPTSKRRRFPLIKYS